MLYQGDGIAGDEMHPLQWVGLNSSGYRTPEVRLMFAILKDAIEILLMGGKVWRGATRNAPGIAKRQALDWVMSEDRDWVFSFSNICSQLDMDDVWIREGIVRVYREIESGEREHIPRRMGPPKPKRHRDVQLTEQGQAA